MTPEARFALELSQTPSSAQEKIASAMENLSLEELELILRHEGFEKDAAGLVSQAVGGLMRGAISSPTAARAAIGAGVGAAGGALAAGDGNRGMGALAGAMGGAALGGQARNIATSVAKHTNFGSKALQNSALRAGDAKTLANATGFRSTYLGNQANKLRSQAAGMTDAAAQSKMVAQADQLQRNSARTMANANPDAAQKRIAYYNAAQQRAAGKAAPAAAQAPAATPAAAPTTPAPAAPTVQAAPVAAQAPTTPAPAPRPPAPVNPKMEAARQEQQRLQRVYDEAAATSKQKTVVQKAPVAPAETTAVRSTAPTSPAMDAARAEQQRLQDLYNNAAATAGQKTVIQRGPNIVQQAAAKGRNLVNRAQEAVGTRMRPVFEGDVVASYNLERVDFNELSVEELEQVLCDHWARESLEKDAGVQRLRRLGMAASKKLNAQGRNSGLTGFSLDAAGERAGLKFERRIARAPGGAEGYLKHVGGKDATPAEAYEKIFTNQGPRHGFKKKQASKNVRNQLKLLQNKMVGVTRKTEPGDKAYHAASSVVERQNAKFWGKGPRRDPELGRMAKDEARGHDVRSNLLQQGFKRNPDGGMTPPALSPAAKARAAYSAKKGV